MIPKTSTNLFQIWISDHNRAPSAFVNEKINSLRAMYPECDYKMYNNSDLLKFLKNNFSSDVLEAYCTVKPYAFKADLARYCLLYMYGGYYFDAAICPKFRYQHDDFAYILQGESHTIDGKLCHALDNGIMYFRDPFNPFLKSAIEKSVENILGRRYGRGSLDITGPQMLYDLDHTMIKKFPYSVVDGKKVTCIDGQIWFEYQHGFSSAVLDKKTCWHNNTMITKEDAEGTNSYSKMWEEKQVFSSTIPKTLLQTSKDPYPEYVQEMWNQRIDDTWTIDWFDDDRIYKFFADNPLPEFPNVIDVFNSFSDGGHRADLFRYYYLYLNGGFFIDSDCMSHVHMNEIHSYCHDHVFVHSDVICNRVHHPEINSPLAFNGVMGCVPKSPIVYAALQNAYNVKPRLLQKQRLYFVYMLYVISQKHKNTCNIRWLHEHVAAADSVCSTILDEDNKKVFTHFFGNNKIIPNTVELE